MIPSDSDGTTAWLGNPLIAPFGPPQLISQIEARLACRPLESIDMRGMNSAELEVLIGMLDQHYVVTAPTLALCPDLQNAWYGGLLSRDPRNAQARRQLETILDFPYLRKRLDELPWFPHSARGILVSGETGTQKSTTIRRFLQALGPQVIRHGPQSQLGWASHFAHLAWLHVDMSSDGSRGGLLTGILMEMDSILGTNYAVTYARTSVERQLVFVASRLVAHACGLLVIDEMQPENFHQSSWQGTFCLFFLKLLNFGIPTVLVGNPKAFVDVTRHAQLLTRFTSGGFHRFRPFHSSRDEDFAKFLSGLWDFSVLPVRTPLDATLKDLYFKGSGGITRQLCSIHKYSIIHALRSGARGLTVEHVKHGIATMQEEEMLLATGFARKHLDMLAHFRDLPWDEYEEKWKPRAGEEKDQPDKNAASGASPKPQSPKAVRATTSPSKKLKAAYDKSQAQQGGAQPKAKKPKKSSSPDDRGANGATRFHLGALEQLFEQESKKNKR